MPYEYVQLLAPDRLISALFDELDRLSPIKRRVAVRLLCKRKSIARFLYKYRGVDGPYAEPTLRDIIIQSALRLQSAAAFNDPFDMAAHIYAEGTDDQRRAKLTQLIRDHEDNPADLDRMLQQYMATPIANVIPALKVSLQRHRTEVGVTCFADKAKNLLMWSHYASDHLGVCLVFDSALDFRTLAHAVAVEYSLDYPSINWLDGFEDQLLPMLTRKNCCWEYEGERRIILAEGAAKYVRFRPEALRAVILGVRVSKETVDLIVSLLQERVAAGMPQFKIYQATMHERQYKLVLRAGPALST